MKFAITIIWIILFSSCDANKVKTELNVENSISNNVQKTDSFNPELIQQLFSLLKEDSELEFNVGHLNSLLKDVEFSSLKSGAEIEKEMLFEEFECDCLDKLKISYSKENERFLLWVYVEHFDEGFDWCPESTFQYSFIIDNNTVKDLKLDFQAG